MLSESEVVHFLTDVQPRVRRVIYGIVKDAGRADELTQEALLKMWKAQGSIESRDTLERWAHVVARNVALSDLKSGYRRKAVLFQSYRESGETNDDPEFEDEASDVEAAFEADERRAILRAKMAKLRPAQRRILSLWAIDELSYEQIALRLRVTIGAMKTQLHRAKLALVAVKPAPLYRKRRPSRRRGKACRCGERWSVARSGLRYCRPCSTVRMRDLRNRRRAAGLVVVIKRRPMYARRGKLRRLREALLSGLSIRAAGRAVGCSHITSARCHRILMSERNGAPILCECGQASTHRGWCRARYLKSQRRQEFWKTQGATLREKSLAVRRKNAA